MIAITVVYTQLPRTVAILLLRGGVLVYVTGSVVPRLTLLAALLAGCVIDDIDDVADLEDEPADEGLVLEDPDPEGKADGATTL